MKKFNFDYIRNEFHVHIYLGMSIMYKVIIFDFDGVIIESLNVKKNAFIKVYVDYPRHSEEIGAYHLMNGGVSRYEKFVHINKNIIGIPVDDSIVSSLAEKFSEIVVDEVSKCPYVKGAKEFIESNHGKRALYIASGTPTEELQLIVKKLGLDRYFNGVYGSPESKSSIIDHILELEGVERNEILFVGDAISDYDNAMLSGVDFVARINSAVPSNPFLEMDVTSVADLASLNKMLGEGGLR